MADPGSNQKYKSGGVRFVVIEDRLDGALIKSIR